VFCGHIRRVADFLKMKSWMRVAIALLLAAAALGESGCHFTNEVSDSINGQAETEAPSMRVQHTYSDGKGRLIVLAEGGPWQKDLAATPREPIWFEADIPSLTVLAHGSSALTLSQSVLKKGLPDLGQLAQDGFVEIPFVEYESVERPSLNGIQAPTNQPFVRIFYSDGMLKAKNFPERLGLYPDFSLKQSSTVPPNASVQLQDVGFPDAQPGMVFLLPLAVIADIAISPVSVPAFLIHPPTFDIWH
jgi:hypothetical protein